MSSNTIFFSYGRNNSAFVLDLAKELRKAGANIWLDQLDIEPGSRWDRSIEKALKASDTLMVILSKDSVDSNNVMDEVSYALEENKTVVPVLMEDCEIPFRLRRLQYADFTKSHQTGIATLIKALRLDQSIASKLTDIASKDDESIQNDIDKINKIRRDQDTKLKQDRLEAAKLKEETARKAALGKEKTNKKPEPQPLKPSPKKSSGISPWLIAGIVILVIGGSLIFLMAIGLATDMEGDFSGNDDIYNPVTPIGTSSSYVSDWNLAQQSNTVEMYLTYIGYYGESNEYYNQALSNLISLLKNEGYMQYAVPDGSIRYFDRITPGGIDSYPQPNDFIKTIAPGYVWTAAPGLDPYAQQNGDLLAIGKIVFVVNVVYSGTTPWVQVRYED